MTYNLRILGSVTAVVDDVVDLYKDVAYERVFDWSERIRAFMDDLVHFPHRNPATGKRDEFGHPIRQTIFGKRRGAWRIIYSIDDQNGLVTVLLLLRGGRGPMSMNDLA